MPVYSGSFPTVASGLTATVKLGATTLGTQEVTGEPDTAGAIAFSYTYDDGDDRTTLTASASSALLGTINTQLVLDASASIAAGGGGGGVVLDPSSVFFEINEGITLDPSGSNPITWDTLPDGYSGSASEIALDPGWYHAAIYLELDAPLETRTVTIGISSQGVNSNAGPYTIAPNGQGTASRTIEGNGQFLLVTEGDFVTISLTTDVLGAEPTPADLECGYGALTITPVARG